MKKKLSVAIDGPSGAGKSSVSLKVSKILGIKHLNTGALYRASALYFLTRNIEINYKNIKSNINNFKIDVNINDCNKQITLLNNINVESKLRKDDISLAAAKISKYKLIRDKMIKTQRDIAYETNIILEGRDIGTVVLPNASHKFFLTADLHIRAQRRYKQNINPGYNESTLKKSTIQIKVRDNIDKERKYGKLVKAVDAYEINTNNLDEDQVVEKILKIIRGGG